MKFFFRKRGVTPIEIQTHFGNICPQSLWCVDVQTWRWVENIQTYEARHCTLFPCLIFARLMCWSRSRAGTRACELATGGRQEAVTGAGRGSWSTQAGLIDQSSDLNPYSVIFSSGSKDQRPPWSTPLIFNQQRVVPLQSKIFGADRSRQGVCDRHRDRWGWGGVNGCQIWARLPQTCSCSLHQTLGCYVISVYATHLSCVTFWLWCVKCSIFSSDICVKFGQVVQCSQIKEVIVHDDTSYIQGSVDNHGQWTWA